MKNIADMVQEYKLTPRLEQVKQDKSVVTEQAIHVFNELFRQLRAAFPAAIIAIKTQEDLNEIRRQWVLAFVENNITHLEQVNVGMRIARQQNKPFLPSVGQFITWCKQGGGYLYGLPDAAQLVELVKKYSNNRHYHDAAGKSPFENKVHYWLVTSVYSSMRLNGWTESELLVGCEKALNAMRERLERGETLPEPISQIEHKSHGQPLSKAESLKRLAEIRLKLGLKK